MMKISRILTILTLAGIVVGCSKKSPYDGADPFGVPMMAETSHTSAENFVLGYERSPELYPMLSELNERRDHLKSLFYTDKAVQEGVNTVRMIAPPIQLTGDVSIDSAARYRVLLVADDLKPGQKFLDVYEVRVAPDPTIAVIRDAKSASSLNNIYKSLLEERLLQLTIDNQRLQADSVELNTLVTELSNDVETAISHLNEKKTKLSDSLTSNVETMNNLGDALASNLNSVVEKEVSFNAASKEAQLLDKQIDDLKDQKATAKYKINSANKDKINAEGALSFIKGEIALIDVSDNAIKDLTSPSSNFPNEVVRLELLVVNNSKELSDLEKKHRELKNQYGRDLNKFKETITSDDNGVDQATFSHILAKINLSQILKTDDFTTPVTNHINSLSSPTVKIILNDFKELVEKLDEKERAIEQISSDLEAIKLRKTFFENKLVVEKSDTQITANNSLLQTLDQNINELESKLEGLQESNKAKEAELSTAALELRKAVGKNPRAIRLEKENRKLQSRIDRIDSQIEKLNEFQRSGMTVSAAEAATSRLITLWSDELKELEKNQNPNALNQSKDFNSAAIVEFIGEGVRKIDQLNIEVLRKPISVAKESSDNITKHKRDELSEFISGLKASGSINLDGSPDDSVVESGFIIFKAKRIQNILPENYSSTHDILNSLIESEEALEVSYESLDPDSEDSKDDFDHKLKRFNRKFEILKQGLSILETELEESPSSDKDGVLAEGKEINEKLKRHRRLQTLMSNVDGALAKIQVILHALANSDVSRNEKVGYGAAVDHYVTNLNNNLGEVKGIRYFADAEKDEESNSGADNAKESNGNDDVDEFAIKESIDDIIIGLNDLEKTFQKDNWMDSDDAEIFTQPDDEESSPSENNRNDQNSERNVKKKIESRISYLNGIRQNISKLQYELGVKTNSLEFDIEDKRKEYIDEGGTPTEFSEGLIIASEGNGSYSLMEKGDLYQFRLNVLRGIVKTTLYVQPYDVSSSVYGDIFADHFFVAQVTLHNPNDKPVIVYGNEMKVVVRMNSSHPNILGEDGEYRRYGWWAVAEPIDYQTVESMLEHIIDNDPRSQAAQILRYISIVGSGAVAAFSSSIDVAKGAAVFSGVFEPSTRELLLSELEKNRSNFQESGFQRIEEIEPLGSLTRNVFLPKGPIFGDWAFNPYIASAIEDDAQSLRDTDSFSNPELDKKFEHFITLKWNKLLKNEKNATKYARLALMPSYITGIRREEVYVKGKRILASDPITAVSQ